MLELDSLPVLLPELRPVNLTYKVLSTIAEHGTIRIQLNDQLWVYNLNKKCYTRYRKGKQVPVPGCVGKTETGPERIDRYKNRADLINKLGHCKPLIAAIDEGISDALLTYRVLGR